MTRTKMLEPLAADATLRNLQARLAERGIEPADAIEGEYRDEAGRLQVAETPQEAEARKRRQQGHREARWQARLPVMYERASMRDVDADDLPRDLLTWLAKEASPTLFIPGPVGTGKTHAAYAIGNTAVARGIWTEAWTVTDLLEAMRPGGDAQGGGDARTARLLILDDLGSGKATEWAVDALTALVDARLREGLRQIITTNHPYPVLEEAWGARLMDRLRYRAVVAKMTGESRRQAPW